MIEKNIKRKAILKGDARGVDFVIPISMTSLLLNKNNLIAVLDLFESIYSSKKITVLVCDFLNRHNVGEDYALKQGEKFLEENENILKNFKTVRWKDFIEERKEKFDKAMSIIRESSEIGTVFYEKMKSTWESCNSASDLEKSINYQREEYAATLCMDEFTDLAYPGKISPGLAYLMRHIDGYKPSYHPIRLVNDVNDKIKNNTESQGYFFSKKEKRKKGMKKLMPLALRMLIDQVETLMSSSEISNFDKKNFAEELENTISGFYPCFSSENNFET